MDPLLSEASGMPPVYYQSHLVPGTAALPTATQTTVKRIAFQKSRSETRNGGWLNGVRLVPLCSGVHRAAVVVCLEMCPAVGYMVNWFHGEQMRAVFELGLFRKVIKDEWCKHVGLRFVIKTYVHFGDDNYRLFWSIKKTTKGQKLSPCGASVDLNCKIFLRTFQSTVEFWGRGPGPPVYRDRRSKCVWCACHLPLKIDWMQMRACLCSTQWACSCTTAHSK